MSAMSWLPWMLLAALAVVLGWAANELGRSLRWTRRALRGETAGRPKGPLVRMLMLDELFDAAERSFDAESAVQEAAARRTEALLAPLSDAVLVVDAQDRLRLANPAACTLFGLGVTDLGESVVPLVRSADFIDLVRRARKEGGAEAAVLLNRAPLADVWLLAAGARMDPAAFGEGAAIFVLTDVTQLKRLQAMEREFVTNVSHDLRTPVTVIRGFAETLAEDHETMPPEDRGRFIGKIVSAAGRLQSLVEGLLALASLESGAEVVKEPGAVHAAVREVAEEFKARAKAAGVKIELDLRAPETSAADPVQARRLVQNLIENALAHALGATRLAIATEATAEGCRLSVSDDGPGVSASDLSRLFDRFYRTDRSRKAGGSGLGLSIVRQVAELHGGTATAEPNRPKGLKVTVTLPAGTR
jgi:signal transduction histidine kinase